MISEEEIELKLKSRTSKKIDSNRINKKDQILLVCYNLNLSISSYLILVVQTYLEYKLSQFDFC